MLTEQQEAEAFSAWLNIKNIKHTHIANETGGDAYSRRRAIRMKRAGTSKGFPDYLIFADGNCIAIELKRSKSGRATKEQLAWLKTLSAHGFKCAVCHGAREAIEFVEEVAK